MQVQRLNAYQNQNFGMINVTRPEGISRITFMAPLLAATRESGVRITSNGFVFSVLTKYRSKKEAAALAKIKIDYKDAKAVRDLPSID